MLGVLVDDFLYQNLMKTVWQAQQPKDNSNYTLVSWAMHTVILGEHMSMYSGMYKQHPPPPRSLTESGEWKSARGDLRADDR